jgi:hypothetical protein
MSHECTRVRSDHVPRTFLDHPFLVANRGFKITPAAVPRFQPAWLLLIRIQSYMHACIIDETKRGGSRLRRRAGGSTAPLAIIGRSLRQICVTKLSRRERERLDEGGETCLMTPSAGKCAITIRSAARHRSIITGTPPRVKSSITDPPEKKPPGRLTLTPLSRPAVCSPPPVLPR